MVKEVKCKSFGGECIESCPPSITGLGSKATDCSPGTTCCVWLTK